jgi:NAD(P)-dependent dehydrogenase (short-subunit alcohol dehydrogenase family)
MLLDNRLAVVTGAGQGNGAAIARGLAAHGARVIATDIVEETAERTASEIRAQGGKAWAYRLDVTDRAAVSVFAQLVGQTIGPASILINNAGICPRNTLDSTNVRETWDQAMAVNLDGTLSLSLSFVPALRETKGAIVNLCSVASFVSTGTSLAYSTSKAAIQMLTKTLAHELAKDGVRVNAVAPGTFVTPMTAVTRNDPERSQRFLSRIPLGRFGDPEELIGPVVFLASSMSSYVTGATLVVDGGYLAV